MPEENSNKWYHIFTAGIYNFGSETEPRIVEITSSELQDIASRYKPGYYEADLHVGHPDMAAEPEPPALGWIAALKVEGDNLMCSFSHLSEAAKKFVNDKMYRWCSIEFGMIADVGRYLTGLGLTNYPRVEDLPELAFSKAHKKNKKITFEEINTFSLNNKITMPVEKKLSPAVETFAQRVGINVADYSVDGDLLEYAAAQIEELKAKYSGDENLKSLSMFIEKYKALPAEVETLKAANTDLQGKLDTAKKETEIDSLIEAAVKDGKLIPLQKESYKKIGMMLPAEDFKATIEKLPKLEMFKSDTVPAVTPEVAEETFKDEKGNLITFDDYVNAQGSRKAEDKKLVERFKKDNAYMKLPGYDNMVVSDSKK